MHVRFSQCVWIVVKWFVVNNICRTDMLSWYKQNCLVIGFILHRHEMFLSQLHWPSFEKGLESGGLPSFCQSPILPGTLHYTEVKTSLSLSLFPFISSRGSGSVATWTWADTCTAMERGRDSCKNWLPDKTDQSFPHLWVKMVLMSSKSLTGRAQDMGLSRRNMMQMELLFQLQILSSSGPFLYPADTRLLVTEAEDRSGSPLPGVVHKKASPAGRHDLSALKLGQR